MGIQFSSSFFSCRFHSANSINTNLNQKGIKWQFKTELITTTTLKSRKQLSHGVACNLQNLPIYLVKGVVQTFMEAFFPSLFKLSELQRTRRLRGKREMKNIPHLQTRLLIILNWRFFFFTLTPNTVFIYLLVFSYVLPDDKRSCVVKINMMGKNQELKKKKKAK